METSRQIRRIRTRNPSETCDFIKNRFILSGVPVKYSKTLIKFLTIPTTRAILTPSKAKALTERNLSAPFVFPRLAHPVFQEE